MAKRELPPLSLLRQASLPSSAAAAAAASRAPEIAATFQRHGGDHACGGQGLAAAHAATVDGLPRLPMRVPYMLPEDLPPEHQEEHMHIWGAPGEQTMPFPMRLLFYFSHATFFLVVRCLLNMHLMAFSQSSFSITENSKTFLNM